jgi:hypothetical protein
MNVFGKISYFQNCPFWQTSAYFKSVVFVGGEGEFVFFKSIIFGKFDLDTYSYIEKNQF